MNQFPPQDLQLRRTTQGQLRRKKSPELTVAILVLVGVGWGIFSMISSKKAERESERKQREEQTRIEQTVSAMVTTHNAVTDWKKGLGEARLELIYTADLQRLLARDDGRPLLFYASIEDVKEQNGRNLLVFETQIDIRATLRLALECDSDQARQVMEQRGPELLKYYAVIGKIRSVQKNADQTVFLAEGRALDLLFVGPYGLLR